MGVTFSTLAFVPGLVIGIAFGIRLCLVCYRLPTKMNLLRFGPILMGGLLTLIIVNCLVLLGMDIDAALTIACIIHRYNNAKYTENEGVVS